MNQPYLTSAGIRDFFDTQSDRIQDSASQLYVHDEKLEIVGTRLIISNAMENVPNRDSFQIDLSTYWLPGTGDFTHPVPLLLYPHYAQTVISKVDSFVQRIKQTPSFKNTVASTFNNSLRFIEWALLNGHYSLESVSEKDVTKLCHALKKGGIPSMLSLPERLEAYLMSIKHSKLLLEGITYDGASLNTSLISKQIGTTSLHGVVPKAFYTKVAYLLKKKGGAVTQRFAESGRDIPAQPSSKSLNTLFCEWNELALLNNKNKLTFYPFKGPYQLSRKLGKAPGRTPNLHVEHITKILGNAHLWLYKAAPLIIEIVVALRAAVDINLHRSTIQGNRFNSVLKSSNELKELEQLLSINISRTNVNLRGKQSNDKWTIVECVTALMTACYIILQTYNARRKSEIQDPYIGIAKEEHFRCVDEHNNWYQACFYNEKHASRYWYTLNNGSTEALRVLFKLKNAWDTKEHSGLFHVPRFSLDNDFNINAYKYEYAKGKVSRITSDQFLAFSLGYDAIHAKGSHIFRRIYAVIYHYQYENAELLALCHQLGHVDPTVTEVYVTDPTAREQHEQLHHKLKRVNSEKVESIKVLSEENKSLEDTIREVGSEKTAEDILSLMLGSSSMAGRYPAYLKRVYKVLSQSVKLRKASEDTYGDSFFNLSKKQQSKIMASILSARGHRHNPKATGNCHRDPTLPKTHRLPCEPQVCKGCPYQQVKRVHLDIMQDDLNELQNMAKDTKELGLLERVRAEESATSLARVISQHERTMKRNAQLFDDLKEKT
ncbi:hypothetical protein F9L16_05275 [Agarivorans sp. B2Z047]|uniref:hypothetical protein n=1 Tax=Agarivorans sp. B2Z047 TaxID=2652721 RepID=UPI00128E6844|nr:hypothetical protein [Agarivorans sp. B2Z047]MPW28412.1 hypothetical protein [Agarivorans sp. B2Z047]UQN43767.1 hypothetical protein LQZ07_04665 [Agarivorans sp. B2Z047]